MSKHPVLELGREIPPEIGKAAKSARQYNTMKKVGMLAAEEGNSIEGTPRIRIMTHNATGEGFLVEVDDWYAVVDGPEAMRQTVDKLTSGEWIIVNVNDSDEFDVDSRFVMGQ